MSEATSASKSEPGEGDESAGAGNREECYAHARSIVLRSLTHSARTHSEIRDKLAKKQVPNDVGEEVLTRFVELGLIDDRALAKSYVEARNAEGWGSLAIARKLAARGVSKVDAASALVGYDSEVDREAALRLARRRWSAYRHLPRKVRQRRLAAVLQRRGHSGYVAEKCVDQVESELVGGEESGTE